RSICKASFRPLFSSLLAHGSPKSTRRWLARSIRAVRLAIDQVKGAGTGPYERGYSCARYLPTSVFEAFKHPLESPLISLIACFFISFPAFFLCGFPRSLTTGFLRNFTRNVIREIVVDRV